MNNNDWNNNYIYQKFGEKIEHQEEEKSVVTKFIVETAIPFPICISTPFSPIISSEEYATHLVDFQFSCPKAATLAPFLSFPSYSNATHSMGRRKGEYLFANLEMKWQV